MKIPEEDLWTNEFYEKHYVELMGTGFVRKVWQKIHRLMEKPFQSNNGKRILEIGAGSGEHFSHVREDFSEYHLTDIRTSKLEGKFSLENVLVSKQDASQLSFGDCRFERVIVTCVLAHLENPLSALREIRRVTANGGCISIYVPCEPGIILRCARKFSTRRKARAMGINEIETLHLLEHRNYFLALDGFVKYVFRDDDITSRFYPLFFLGWNSNLFKIYHITVSKSYDKN